jgi:hypothetical protein
LPQKQLPTLGVPETPSVAIPELHMNARALQASAVMVSAMALPSLSCFGTQAPLSPSSRQNWLLEQSSCA